MSQENTPAEVFLSYSRQDEVCAARLERDLQAKDIDVWRDLRAIQGGHDWENEIRSAIRASSSLIYLGTPAARDSGAVRGEVTIARTYNKPIHPVFAAGKDWVDVATLELIPKQYFDIREGQYQEGVKQLADRIRQRSQSDLSINGSQE